MFVLIVSLTIHEFAHAKSAELCGDDTAKLAGRTSLNPLHHLDPFGTVMMVMSSIAGFGIGWAKPVPVNMMRLRHPRWDNLKISLWGPLSNLLLATVCGLVIRFAHNHLTDRDITILIAFVFINLALALFNMIPIAPLDGSHILSSLLPVNLARNYDRFMGQYGFMMLIGLIMLPRVTNIDLIDILLAKPAELLLKLIVGI